MQCRDPGRHMHIAFNVYESMETYIHARVRVNLCTYMHTFMHICVHTYRILTGSANWDLTVLRYVHTCVCAYIHTYMHACVHTYSILTQARIRI